MNIYEEFLRQLLPIFPVIFFSTFGTLGVVYAAGRLWNEAMGDSAKNRLALFTIPLITALVIAWVEIERTARIILTHTIPPVFAVRFTMEVVIYSLITYVFYVTIGWRFYDRMNTFLDQRFAEGKRRREAKRRKKK